MSLIKHATASVFLFGLVDGGWRIGLIRHPRFGRWMLPGGHVEPDENPAEAALREVREEAGVTASLLLPYVGIVPDYPAAVRVPVVGFGEPASERPDKRVLITHEHRATGRVVRTDDQDA